MALKCELLLFTAHSNGENGGCVGQYSDETELICLIKTTASQRSYIKHMVAHSKS